MRLHGDGNNEKNTLSTLAQDLRLVNITQNDRKL